MTNEQIINTSADFVSAYMKEHENRNLLYHNLTHTKNVVTAVTELALHCGLNEDESSICVVAAWFHDIGYYEDIVNHERAGANKAEEFLITHNVEECTINAVRNCILATKMPQSPCNLLEKIICDADLYHFGTDDFWVKDRLMRKETEAIRHIQIDEDEWRDGTICLLENHCYHTNYCKDLLNKKKQQNLEKLQKTKNWRAITINPICIPRYITNKLEIQEALKTTSIFAETKS